MDPPTNRENDAYFTGGSSPNESEAQSPSKVEDDNIVTEISQNDDRNEGLSSRGGKYNLKPNPQHKLLRRLQILTN